MRKQLRFSVAYPELFSAYSLSEAFPRFQLPDLRELQNQDPCGMRLKVCSCGERFWVSIISVDRIPGGSVYYCLVIQSHLFQSHAHGIELGDVIAVREEHVFEMEEIPDGPHVVEVVPTSYNQPDETDDPNSI